MKLLKLTARRAALATLVVALPLAAQDSLPAAKVLMERHNDASGGRAALDRRVSIKFTANVTFGEMTATVEIFRAKPDKFFSRTKLGAMGELLEGYDGKVGWSVNPMGPQLASGEMLDIMKGNADFFANFEDHARYSRAETVERTVFEGRPSYKVRLVRGTRQATEYFDVVTGLRSGLVVENEVGGGLVESTTTYSDYTDYGGVKFARKISSRSSAGGPGGGATITFTNVEYDKVDPAVFDPPASVKALIKP